MINIRIVHFNIRYDLVSDIDECKEDPFPCDEVTEDCINEVPGFLCVCKDGFFRDPVTGLCLIICADGFRRNANNKCGG